LERKVEKMGEEIRRLTGVIERMGKGMTEGMNRILAGNQRTRREMRGLRDLMDKDWEVYSESEEDGNWTEDSEDLEGELEILNEMNGVVDELVDGTGDAESDDGEENEESDREIRRREKGKQRAKEDESEPEGTDDGENGEDEDDDEMDE
jgi:hypothetical protein